MELTEPLRDILDVGSRGGEGEEAHAGPEGAHARDDDFEDSAADVEANKVALIDPSAIKS